MEFFTQEMRDMWKNWELRLIVLLSLLLQIVLLVGSRRKSISHATLRAVVWSTYLAAESVAAFGLGVVSNRLVDIKDRSSGLLDPSSQLIAFWAPFLLLHLGGPDVITAYALEDNELWLRYLARLVVQTGVAVYIYFMAITGSKLSIVACVIIAIGFVKYGERVLCLYHASREHLRDSLLSPPDLGYPMIIDRYRLKQQEGYTVTMEVVGSEVQIPEILSEDSPPSAEEDDKNIIVASEMFEIIKCLFVDLIRSSNDLESSKHLFKGLNPERAFKIVEIELLFMYELLYNKAILLSSYWGAVSRVMSVSSFAGVLVFFSLEDKTIYKEPIDVAITYVLLASSAAMDLYLALRLLSIDWVRSKRIQNPKSLNSKIMESVDILWKEPRWSSKVAQFSLVKFSLDQKSPYIWLKQLQIAKLVEKVQTHFAVSYKELMNYMRDWICDHVKLKLEDHEKNTVYRDTRSMLAQYQVEEILMKQNQHNLTWSTKDIDFDLSILIWHIATELCYYHDRRYMIEKEGDARNNYRMSKIISRYMLYLLVVNPAMLPVGTGQLRYADALIEARSYFEEQKTILKNYSDESDLSPWARIINDCLNPSSEDKNVENCHCSKPPDAEASTTREKAIMEANQRRLRNHNQTLCKACKLLLERVDGVPPNIFAGGGSKSELLSASTLAMELNKMVTGDDKDRAKQLDTKWKMIADVWAETLLYAACRSSGHEHAKKLSEGGELLSHVWILMAHFGISEKIRRSQGNVITKIITN